MNEPDVEQMLYYAKQMLRIRKFEEKLNTLYSEGHIRGTLHLCVGQEAVSVGACAALDERDYITSTHRGHGHFIAKGGDLRQIMAEVWGLAAGCCGGRGGTQHMADFGIGHVGSNGITGGQIPVATGAALAVKMKGEDRVVLCFFGDGAANEGVFHESLNMAAVWGLPIVYVCENNLYAMSTPVSSAFKIADIAVRADSYGMPGFIVDGMDVIEVKRVVGQAVEGCRRTHGPALVECKTYRFLGHSKSDLRIYRTREEESSWVNRDPLKVLYERLPKEEATQEQLRQSEESIAREIDEAVDFAKNCANALLAES